MRLLRLRVAVRYFRRFISSRNLDDHELALVMKTQRSLDKAALGRPNPVPGDLDFHEPNLVRLPPGEHIEEAAQLAVIGGTQPLKCLDCPDRCASISQCPKSRSGKPFRPQPVIEGRDPDPVPAVTPQVLDNGQLSAGPASIHRELRLRAPRALQVRRVWPSLPLLQIPPLGGDVNRPLRQVERRRRAFGDLDVTPIPPRDAQISGAGMGIGPICLRRANGGTTSTSRCAGVSATIVALRRR
jgi:hypothetical protein